MASKNKNKARIPTDSDYEKAELDLLRESLKRSYTERFDMMANLMEMGMLLKKAKITHKQAGRKNESE